jgi:RNA polymerase sigma factor (sigma-70 family)
LYAAVKANFMDNPRTETIVHVIDALFRFGVVSGLSDAELLERFVAGSGCDTGSASAFDAIVRRHGPMVFGVCVRVLGDYHAAEDAFQATFMVLAVRAKAIRKRESLCPWLHGVAARIARRALILGRRRREEAGRSSARLETAGRDPALAELSAILDEELSRLPDKYRLPLVLCYLEGDTQEEAARKLGWTKGTVSGRLARAKDLLRGRLVRRGLAPSASIVAAALTSRTASAALPESLLAATVRAATAASLGVMERTLVSGRVAALARQSLNLMSLGQLGMAAAQIVALTLGTAAIATPVILGWNPARNANAGAGPLAVAGHLANTPSPQARASRRDRYGDPLPPRVRLRLGTTQRRHPTEVVGVDFTADGKSVVTARADGIVHFWDPASGRTVRTIDLMGDDRTPDQAIRNFTISADGRFVAALSTRPDPVTHSWVRSVWVRRLLDGGPVRTIVENTAGIDSLAISADGATLATGATDGHVRLWDVGSGASRSTIKLDLRSIPLLAFAPDGKTLAIGALGGKITLWDLEQERGTTLADLTNGPFAPCFSTDGRLMAVNAIDGQTVIVNRTTGRRQLTSRGIGYAFAPDGRSLAMTDVSGALQVIDTITGAHTWECDLGYGLGTAGVAFSPDGRAIVTSRGGVLRFFEAQSGQERLANVEAHQGGVKVVAYTPDGAAILTAGDDGTVRLWDARNARQLKVFPHSGRVHLLAVSPDGRSLATAALLPDSSVRVWDLETGRRTHEWPGHGDLTGAEALAFSADGQFVLSYGRDNVLKVREFETGRERPAVQPQFLLVKGEGPDSGMLGGAFAPGNRFLCVNTRESSHVADLATGEERFFTRSSKIAFTPDGQSVAVATEAQPRDRPLVDRSGASNNDGVDFVNIGSMSSQRIEVAKDGANAFAFTEDGSVVAVAGGNRNQIIRLYRTDDGRKIEEIICPAGRTHPGAMAFSPDGHSLATGLDDTTVLIWDVSNGR